MAPSLKCQAPITPVFIRSIHLYSYRPVTNGLNQNALDVIKPSPSPLLSSALKPVLFKDRYHLCSPEPSQQETVSAILKDSIGDQTALPIWSKTIEINFQYTRTLNYPQTFPNVNSISPVFYICPYVLLG